MARQHAELRQLLKDNPQLGILVSEVLGPPLGLRPDSGARERDEET